MLIVLNIELIFCLDFFWTVTMNATRGAVDACGWQIEPAMSGGDISSLRYLDLITYPFLLLLATVGNFFTLMVLGRADKGRSRSKGTYIIAIAIADVTFMWFSLFSYIHSYDGELRGEPTPSLTAFYEQIAGIAMFIQETVAIASAWLIIAFTAERFLAIRWPMLHHRISQGKRSLQISVAIFCLSSLVAVVRLIDYYRYYTIFLQPVPRPARPPPRPLWLLRWYSTYLWIQAIMQISTFLVIFILNICLLLTILHQRRFRKENLQPTVSAEQTKRSDWSTLPMLSACVVLYLVTQIPEFIDNAIFLLEKGCVMQASGDLKAIIKPVANFLANVNFSVNFLLYCGVDGKFRRKLGSLMTSWKDVTNFGAPSRLRHILGGSPATAPPSHAATKSTTSGTSATSSKGLIG